MDNVSVNYKITPMQYRMMSYFTTYAIRRGQSLFVGVVFIVSIVTLVLDFLNTIELSRPTHLCVLFVTISVLIITIGIELNVYRFRTNDNNFKDVVQTTTFNEVGIKYERKTFESTGFDKWKNILYGFETPNFFILYKSAKSAVVIPKNNQEKNIIEGISDILKEKLGKNYKNRM